MVLLSGRFVSIAGLEECQTPLGAVWQFVLGFKVIALYILIEDLNDLESKLIYFLTSRYSNVLKLV
jgi:hypothetical protein